MIEKCVTSTVLEEYYSFTKTAEGDIDLEMIQYIYIYVYIYIYMHACMYVCMYV